MIEGTRCLFTDTMLRVESLEAAAKFWTEVMGMVEVERNADGIILEDPDTSQRITLVSADIGARFALALAVDDLLDTLERLGRSGAEVTQPQKSDSGFEYALCRDPSGIPIMVYSAG
jgi:predicted enzyme related to lactoylglutathione lyase